MKFLFLAFFLNAVALGAELPHLAGLEVTTEIPFSHEFSQATKGTVVVFLSVVCPCSNSHIEHLNKLKSEFPEYEFIGIHSNADESSADSKKHFSELKLPFKVIRDKDSEWANRLKAFRTPHAYLISKSGEILYQGGVTSSSVPAEAEQSYLKDALLAHSSNRPIKTERARVLGCEIARK